MSDNADISAKKKREATGVPFTKDDPRINRSGRPPGSIDPLKAIGKRLATMDAMQLFTKARQKRIRLIMGQESVTLEEAIMLELATSVNPAKMAMFLERTYGKVPNVNVNQNSNTGFDFTKYIKKYTDAELEAITAGADALEILLNKIPDVEDVEEE